MKRHFAEWMLLIVAIVGMVMLLGVGRGAREDFDSLVVDKDRWYELISSREKVSEGLVRQVSFNREELMMAENGAEWYYSLVERQESAKNPEVLYRSDEGVKLAVLEDKITDDKIRSGEAIKVMAYSDSKYELYELFVTTLPVMSIEHTGTQDMGKNDGEEMMKLKLFDNRAEATQRVVMTDGKIRVRGAMAATFPKQGFRLNLRMMSVGENRRANEVPLLGMRQDDDWILYAGYNDQEKIRNVFATNLWKEGQAKDNDFKLDNGVEYKYVELIMNDEYYGLYALGYPVDELVLRLKKGADGLYEEFSFKKAEWSLAAGGLGGYELQTETTDTRVAWNELRKYVNTVVDGLDAQKIRETVDMKTAINLHLFIELAQSADSLSWEENDTKNLFLTAKEWGKGYKWIYTPWDLDLTFGNYWVEDGKNLTEAYKIRATDEVKLVGSVVTRLEKLGDEKISSEVKAQYRKLREGVWSEDSLMEMIDEYEKEIYRSGAFSRDMARWPEGSHNDAEDELTKFREYLLGRVQTLDNKYL